MLCVITRIVGFVHLVKQCEWDYEDGRVCPDVPDEEKFDWECDPRTSKCEDGQYPAGYPGVDLATVNLGARSLQFVSENVTKINSKPEPSPVTGQPVIISPILTQNIGDISALGSRPEFYHSNSTARLSVNSDQFEEQSRVRNRNSNSIHARILYERHVEIYYNQYNKQ